MGPRRGEVLGLRWADLTLGPPKPHVTIRRTRVIAESGFVVTSEPKTARGRRSLPIDSELVRALASLLETQAEERALVGGSVRPDDYVAVDQLGRPISPDRYTSMFHRLVECAGVPRVRLHDVRHTALTLMALRGVPLPIVAAWAGHADPVFTLRVYAHAQDDAMREASDLMATSMREKV